jgi:hypothetical protein
MRSHLTLTGRGAESLVKKEDVDKAREALGALGNSKDKE